MQPSVPSVSSVPAIPANTGGLSIAAHDFEAAIKASYSESEQDTLRFWFFAAREHNWSLGRLAQLTGISTTVLSRVFRCVYPGDSAATIDKLRQAREHFHESSDNPDFIETSLSKRMFAVFDKTRALRTVSIMWGQMGIGKTECITEYQRRNNHGRTQVVRFPAGATFAFFISHLARSCGVAVRSQSAFEQRGKILQVLNAGQRLLIIDELHQAFLTTRADTAVKCCEFLREIADTASCGLALVGTEVLEQAFFRGPHKDALGQLVDRGTVQVCLPPKATQNDYRKFLSAYGLDLPGDAEPLAQAMLADIIKSAGLRKLTLHLRDGAAYAAKRDEDYAWPHFVAAFQAIQSLAKH
jgi:DNA transposition AAA+ family ATPase